MLQQRLIYVQGVVIISCKRIKSPLICCLFVSPAAVPVLPNTSALSHRLLHDHCLANVAKCAKHTNRICLSANKLL